LNEAHQYRGVRGNEMACFQAPKQRLKEASGFGFSCIATSAPWSWENDKKNMFRFCYDCLARIYSGGCDPGKTESIPILAAAVLSEEYVLLEKMLDSGKG